MPAWSAPQRPAAYAEQTLVTAILDGEYPAGSNLPGERDLAEQLGVTRPTLREVLQRLERDGWVTIRQGKPTRVNDFWQHGGLNVLSALVHLDRQLPPDFVTHLLEVRLAMAPAYARAAVARSAQQVAQALDGAAALDDGPAAYAAFDWTVHHSLTVLSGNPVYTLMLNGFGGFYQRVACMYFSNLETRAVSRAFYTTLQEAASRCDAEGAERITREVMEESIRLWRVVGEQGGDVKSKDVKRKGQTRRRKQARAQELNAEA